MEGREVEEARMAPDEAPLTREERDALMAAHADASARQNRAAAAGAFDEARAATAEARRLEGEYLRRLPWIAMGCCPHCGQVLRSPFDPFGLDGLWWRAGTLPVAPEACDHFCVLLGAVNYGGELPGPVPFECHPGPEVPYVIPRLLSLPGVVAVIGRVPMETGYTAYPIAYFAARPLPAEVLVPSWGRVTYSYVDASGRGGWKGANDPWDFGLDPWLNSGKVRWCPPDSDNTTLSEEPPAAYPYRDLEGRRVRVLSRGGPFMEGGLPDGEPLEPVDA
jgi:hypothetical protein